MKLSYAQKRELYQNGFVRIPNVVPRSMVELALKEINHSLGEGIDPHQLPVFRAQSYCPDVKTSPAITDLYYNTPAHRLCESVIGEGKIKPIGAGQIALRFPSLIDPPHSPSPHIDGMYSPTNGVPKGKIMNFTALVGVYLSDVHDDYCGNFTVWPGTHHIYEQYFKENGPEALLNGMPPVEIPEMHQVKGNAGDIIIAHYLLGHTAAINVSPFIRYAIFFRLEHTEHDSRMFESMTDAWLEWEGINELKEEFERIA